MPKSAPLETIMMSQKPKGEEKKTNASQGASPNPVELWKTNEWN
jgi:hypothetical protein